MLLREFLCNCILISYFVTVAACYFVTVLCIRTVHPMSVFLSVLHKLRITSLIHKNDVGLRVMFIFFCDMTEHAASDCNRSVQRMLYFAHELKCPQPCTSISCECSNLAVWDAGPSMIQTT